MPLIDHIDFVTGVSGGAVPAAYFGLKRRAALEDFRERFLIRNAEEELNTAVSLGNISRAVAGGVNEDTRFRNWLDANLFEGATFSALLTERRPRIWINATDIYNGTPFVFGKTASARSAAILPTIRSRARSRRPPRCRSCSRPSCWRPFRTGAIRRSRPGSQGAPRPNPRRCCGPSRKASAAIATGR